MSRYQEALKKPTYSMEALLDAIYENESSSGRNKKAYSPDKFGSLGGYQMRDVTFNDLKRIYPSKYANADFNKFMMDDNLAREAAKDHISVIQNYLTGKGIDPTVADLLASYNMGMGAVAKRKALPKITQDYVAKAIAYMESRSR